MTDLVLIGLATWYWAYALTSTHGPLGVFDWIRDVIPHGRTSELRVKPDVDREFKRGEIIPKEYLDKTYTQKIPGLLDCPICLAFWVALAFLLAPMGVFTQASALAGAAMLMHGLAGWRFGQ